VSIDRSPGILSVGSALPRHFATQEQIFETTRRIWANAAIDLGKVDSLHRAVKVGGRHLALPLEEYERGTFGSFNDAFIRVGTEIGEQALRQALERAGLPASAIDHLYVVSTTGVATPNLDARLINRVGLRPDTRRTPLFGLGCLGGSAGLARAADYLRAFPDQIAALVSVELCSLTVQRDDASIANGIAFGLFGDGAAAVVLGGAQRAGSGPRVVTSRSFFYPETEWVMGWQVVDTGFRLVLSPKLPDIVREHVGADVDQLLAAQGLGRGDVRHWVCHPGGPKILKAIQESLGLPQEALAPSWKSLSEIGNLSSASVLFILKEALEAGRPGEYGMMMSMGPGFSTELVLLQW
jgi:alkylresorcinol/alkylpyrone synthase